MAGSAAAGRYFPQFISADGTRIDDILGPGHWLISRGDLANSDLAPFAAALSQWLDKHGAEAVLVRPDRYIFATGPSGLIGAAWQKLAGGGQ